MASAAGTRAAAVVALLFSFSAVVFLFLLQAPPPGLTADLLASALDRFLDGLGLLELATRRNMILLCHAILLVILRDAGVLGAPRRRGSRSPPPDAVVVITAAVVAQTNADPAPTRSSAVVWRPRPRNRAVVVAPMHDAAAAAATRRLVEWQPAPEAVATWAAPVQTRGPPVQAAEEAAAAVSSKQMAVVESPRNDDDDDLIDHHDRAAIVEQRDNPAAIAADGETDCDDRRIVAIAAADENDTAREQPTAGMEMEMELADDRTFEEFIRSQRTKMWQESLRLVSSDYHCQAIATCY